MAENFHRGITWEDFPGNKDTLMRKIAAKKRKGFATSAFQFRKRKKPCSTN